MEYVFEDFSIVKDSLKAILTPELSIIGKSAVGGIGRAFIGAAGTAATESAKNGYEIDWNYLLCGEEELDFAEANDSPFTYVEPADYIPEYLRKKYKLGEYAEDEDEAESKDENGQ